MYEYKGKIKRVVDADTLDVVINLGFNVCIETRVRLYGLDAPEIYGVKKESEEYQKGQAATKFVEEWSKNNNAECVIKSYKDKQGKYGRYIATLYNTDKSSCLNEELVENGHAEVVFYD